MPPLQQDPPHTHQPNYKYEWGQRQLPELFLPGQQEKLRLDQPACGTDRSLSEKCWARPTQAPIVDKLSSCTVPSAKVSLHLTRLELEMAVNLGKPYLQSSTSTRRPEVLRLLLQNHENRRDVKAGWPEPSQRLSYDIHLSEEPEEDHHHCQKPTVHDFHL